MIAKKQILVVEDNDLNREMLVEILSDQYAVLETRNGQEALEILRRQGEEIALILLDMMMPVMDGFAFLDQIKVDNTLALIPVIVMTQSNNEDDEVIALAHGATDFVPKPYRPQVILHRVASIINLRENAAMVNAFKYDRLTGLYSKEFFYRKVQEQLRENPDRAYTIVSSNIENFKLYNDTFGAPAGDRLLREIADSFRMLVGADGICGRFSADRFLCLRESSKERLDRNRFLGETQDTLPDHLKSVIMKWGIYEITDPSVPVEKMCDRALLAVDCIKGQYNQPFAVYDDALRSKLLREKAITDAMETALEQGQFIVYLQPKYSLRNDRLVGAEALARWNHPEWGTMAPGEFIPLFEKNGFITRLDRYVWEQVCILLRDWKEKGYPSLPVSVNMSRADVYQANLLDTLGGLVSKYGIEPAQLHLELTETAYTENPAQIISTVGLLRNRGFIIEMDDFGSGYSSLNMLNQMKLDVLKLDMRFIQSETEKPMGRGILHFIVGLARWLNLSVVAEGVETGEQLEHLRDIGCDYVQGYFFARPMPAGEYEKMLKDESGKQQSLAFAVEAKQKLDMQSLLVADEDAEYRANVRRVFEGQYQVLEASDAVGALARIGEAGRETIAAVIMSATLPQQGATSLLEGLRRDSLLWRVPVLTTIPSGEDTEQMIEGLDTDDFLCKRHPLRDLRRRVRRLISIASWREREQKLEDEAFRDYLTGLMNRRGLYAAIDALRQEDLPLAMFFFDLDDLKRINDQYGHKAGDEMIRFFGQSLRRQVRSGDIMGRYGGDEFVVLLRRVSSTEAALEKGNDICRKFREYSPAEGVHVTCSCGVVLCGPDEKPSLKLIDRADQALYRAKRENKGSCCLWKE